MLLLSLLGGLTMIAGASDRRFRKPQGPNEMKITTVVKTVEESRHLWVTGRERMSIYASMYVYVSNSQEEVP